MKWGKGCPLDTVEHMNMRRDVRIETLKRLIERRLAQVKEWEAELGRLVMDKEARV